MTLSIIIPTLNEANYLRKTLHALKVNAVTDVMREVIVVDAGSTDKTGLIAIKSGARVIYEIDPPKGRAFLLNRGVEFATGDIVMFLDADSIVPKDFDQLILDAFAKHKVVGGAFEFKLDGRDWRLRVVEFINRLRYRIFPWYYGDQGIFVKTEYFKKVGGFPQQTMMESSDLCRILWKQGRLVLIKKNMFTSARRFEENGIFTMLGRDFEIWLQDILGKDVEKYAQEYWGFNDK